MRRVIIITDDLVDLYNKEYLATHPRAKKKPIERGFVALNTILSSPSRMIIANYKKKYGEFYGWVIRYYKMSGLKLKNVQIHLHFIRKTKVKSDLDNLASFTFKSLQDAMVKEEMIVADDFFVLTDISADAEYVKGVEKIEIVIRGE